jgi:hypothetical protein
VEDVDAIQTKTNDRIIRQKIRKCPTFDASNYRTEEYRYYGLTPRELRRIERRRS